MRELMFVAGAVAVALVSACDRPQAPPKAEEPVAVSKAEPAPPDAGTTYFCDDGRKVVAAYVPPQTATIDVDGRSHAMTSAVSGSGARYVGDGLQWWGKGMDRARLSVLKPGEDVAADPGVNCSTIDAEVSPPEPGQPGGLPNDRTPISEAHVTAESAQGAADVVQTYFALLGEGKAAETGRLRTDGRVEDLSAFRSYRALVGAPGPMEGAADSSFVEVPVVIYGRLKAGPEYHRSGKATLRRVNGVPGASADQLRWRIEKIEVSPTPGRS